MTSIRPPRAVTWPAWLITARSVSGRRRTHGRPRLQPPPRPRPRLQTRPRPQPRLQTHPRPRPRPRRRDLALAGGLLAGVALDSLLGDPRRGHPVAGFGRAAAALERRAYADDRTRGVLYTAACIVLAAAAAAAARRLARRHLLARGTAVAITVWTVTGGRSLRSEAGKTVAALDQQDLEAARSQLPALCSRDPKQLGPKDRKSVV